MTENMCHVHSWIKIQSGHFLKRETGIFNSEVVPPTSPGTSSLTLPALLHKRGRRRKGKAKVRLRGNVPPVWDPAEPGQRGWRCAGGTEHPGGRLLPQGRRAQRGCSQAQ